MATMEQQVESIVDTILEDYRNGRSIDRMNPFAHPDKEVVIDMIGKLMRIVYPGFSRDKNYRIYNTHHNLSMLIEDVMYNMVKQLTMVFRADMEEQQAQEKAQQVSLDFFRAIPALRDVIQTDVEAFYDGDPAAYSTDEIVYCYPGIFAITVYRLAHVLYAMGVPLLPRIMTQRDGHRYQPRGRHRQVFLHRPRHRHRHRRDHGHRGPCEGLPGRDIGRTDYPGGPKPAGQAPPSHH